MSLNLGLVLLGVTASAVFRPTDYSAVANISPRCEKRIVRCGEFSEPTDDVGNYVCKFNGKSCVFSCQMKCPREKNNVWMTISNKRHAREAYVCSGGEWTRRGAQKAFCVARMPVPEVIQNFHHTNELNQLVNSLFNTSYLYLGMASYYERADIALSGFSKYMTELWQKETTYARDVMSYVNKRGGFITLYDIPRPSSHEMLLLNKTGRPGQAGMQAALQLVKDVNDFALNLHKDVSEAGRMNDPHLKHFLEDGIISDKVEIIMKLADYVTRLGSFSDEDYSIGEYSVDVELGK